MNNELAKILGFNFSASDYALAAKTLLSRSEKKGIDDNIKRLEAIAERCRGIEERIPAKTLQTKFLIVFVFPIKFLKNFLSLPES